MSEMAFAFEQLGTAGEDRQTAIHECRKAIKRLRALARLAKHRDHRAYRRLDKALRRAGRALSGQRDADVAAATIELIRPDLATGDLLGGLRASTGNHIGDTHGLTRASKALNKARRRFEMLVKSSDRWSADDLQAGVKTQYRRFRRNACTYLTTRAPKDAHELRKSLQRHLAQLRLVDSLTVSDLNARIVELNGLSQQLGTHHDLTMLRKLLRCSRKKLDKSTRKLLCHEAKARQKMLDAEITVRLPSTIDMKPALFVRAIAAAHPTPNTPVVISSVRTYRIEPCDL